MPIKGQGFSSRIMRWPKLVAQSILPGPAERRTQAQRRIALFFHKKFPKEMTFERNGFLWTGTPGCLISEAIFLHDHYQDDSIEGLAKFLKFGRSTVVNIGAAIGDVALPLTRTWKTVIAIEPTPSTFALLQRNVRQNHLEEQIICYQAAVSDVTGERELVVYDEPAACELVGDDGRVGYGDRKYRERVSVKTWRLDGLLDSLQVLPEDVGLVWSDTQGFESQVMESAPNLWAGGTCLWVEVWPQGLEAHGGTAHFVEVCKEYFSRFVTEKTLNGEAQEVAALGAVAAKLGYGEHIDVLLIP
jgi:FkbM family methyltransferase